MKTSALEEKHIRPWGLANGFTPKNTLPFGVGEVEFHPDLAFALAHLGSGAENSIYPASRVLMKIQFPHRSLLCTHQLTLYSCLGLRS